MKVKKVPQRTCLGCKTIRPKKELIRVVRTPEGEVVLDLTGKKSGRGAYTCPKLECLELTFKGSLLERALETEITAEIKENLRSEIVKLLR
ncbi:hypothetical protein EDC14_105321 [Hydrogenispora ethanolica]|jgi:predicted RNA-binding protein YlxR (DUF448 family)|uniref:YlxR domain-containing protein n=1 Tax=Hydrogenispora ethanolica TaxID=1082276 RepID=A0A4R1QR03_HYDET|nr:YlxR family protein [Hydrogenispora ethanolica]TCL55857.1 hypothetical protein EDC14_105321 [Hydrogenispora ethanolica]